MRKYLAIAAAFAAFGSVVAVGTASAQAGSEAVTFQHIVTVTKDVEGAVPDEATFVVEVECGAKDSDLTFDEDGGTKSVTVGDSSASQTCSIEEGNDGGASDTEISGSPCEFTGTETVGAAIDQSYPDEVCEVSIENSFDPEVTTTTAPPVIGEQPVVVPAPAIAASPALTG